MLAHLRLGMLAAVLLASATAMAADLAVKCEAAKLKVSSKYAACLLKAEESAVREGADPDYSRCDSKFSDLWRKTEAAAGTDICPSEGDETAILEFLYACGASVAEALAGAALLPDPVTCDQDLSACHPSLSGCNSDLGACNTELSAKNADLATCHSALCGNGVLEAGEDCEVAWALRTTFHTGSDCAGEGFDAGTLACGAGCVYDTSNCRKRICGDGFVDPPEQCDDQNPIDGDGCSSTCQSEARFVDNSDGTITDNQTGLMWEKKSDNGDIHDKDDNYSWSADNGLNDPDGTVYTEFLPALNNGNFAGHGDWRLPTIEELQTLTDSDSQDPPHTHPIFKDGAVSGCHTIDPSCSWTRSTRYWSSTTDQSFTGHVWIVHFLGGLAGINPKTNSYAVRAVRDGF